MNITYQSFPALDLWDCEPVPVPGHPAKRMCLRLTSKKNSPEGFGGFGIYALSYRHQDGIDRIIYLGKFAGEKSASRGVDNAFGGDVRDRWYKHIGTATLLLRGLKMASRPRYSAHQQRALEHFANDPSFREAYTDSFLDISNEELSQHVFIKGADLQVSSNRLGFAIQNLVDTQIDVSNAVPCDSKDVAAALERVIDRFTLHYWRVTAQDPVRKSEINALLTGSKNQKGVERSLIEHYRHRLPMNAEYRLPDSLNAFYHYDPSGLIQVGSEDFNDLDLLITKRLGWLLSGLNDHS